MASPLCSWCESTSTPKIITEADRHNIRGVMAVKVVADTAKFTVERLKRRVF